MRKTTHLSDEPPFIMPIRGLKVYNYQKYPKKCVFIAKMKNAAKKVMS